MKSTGADLSEPVLEMEPDRPWFPRLQDCSAWGLSLGLHVVVLLVLGTIHFELDQRLVTVIDSAFEESNPEDYIFEATVTDQIGTDSSVNSLAASQEAASQLGKDPQQEIESQIDETVEIPVPAPEEVVDPPKAEMLASVSTTGGTEHVGGVEGAIDRVAFEIANSLREKKTLVVWVLDVSPSLHVRREKIAQRIENVYGQLNALNVGADKALKSAVVAFGEKAKIVTPDPLSDTTEIVKAVRELKSENGGRENTFQAIIESASKFLVYRTKMNHNMMMVIVTDEAGSDLEKLDEAIQRTKKYGVRCYAIGDGAPLGRRIVESEFRMENGETVIGVWERGPEAFYQDRLNLGFWGADGWPLEWIPSGFGPYSLTRLCAETGGLYLISERDDSFPVDPVVMRSYAPDYRPVSMIDADIRKNLAKQALVKVCEQYKIGAEQIPLPATFFPAENDNILRTGLADAQRPLAELDYRLDTLQKELELGEKDRAKLKEPRWRAAFDLALGRVLAMRVRSFGYNAMLAEMRVSPKKFAESTSNAWRLVPSSEVTSGATARKMATKARELLKRVIDEHPGTPWAVLAEKEYSIPIGWEWREQTYTPAPAMMAGDEKRGPKFVEEIDPATGKKVKREVPAIPQRRDI
jgi:hypothetical protein